MRHNHQHLSFLGGGAASSLILVVFSAAKRQRNDGSDAVEQHVLHDPACHNPRSSESTVYVESCLGWENSSYVSL